MDDSTRRLRRRRRRGTAIPSVVVDIAEGRDFTSRMKLSSPLNQLASECAVACTGSPI